MSLIHWDKSVLSFHLKEIIEDGNGNNPLALAGLGVIAANALLVPAVMKLGKPVLKAAIKKSLPLPQNSSAFSTPSSHTEVKQIWQQAAIASQNNNSSSDRASNKIATISQ
ncbi:MAG: hypothetical protein ACLFQP_05860 [Halothece sp.]